jgi:hypothetical protein
VTARAVAQTLATAAWCALALGTLVLALGPLSFAPIGLSISGPSRLFGVAAGLLAGAALTRGPRPLLDDLAVAPAPAIVSAAFAALLLAGALVARGSLSVGGADSAGYLAQATRWHVGSVRLPIPLEIPGLSDAAWRQSGLGFRPAPSGDAIVPSYPPGLPWLQAAALGIGGETAAVRWLPIGAAMLALVAVFLLARGHAGASGAALAVVALASLPPFLFQALQPMSDVPALAAWLLALALAMRPGWSCAAACALATIIAILVRPNLAPLVVPVCWQAWIATSSCTGQRRRTGLVAVAAVAAVGLVALVQATLYGSPFQSGYGSASELFSATHIAPNAGLYPRWLLESVSGPGLVMLVSGAAWLATCGIRQRSLRPALAMASMTIALYLVYVPFDSWTYLRFVLIALALSLVGAACVLQRGSHRLPVPWRFPVFCALVLLVAIPNLQRARQLGVFDVRAREYRYEAAGRFVHDRFPASVVIVAAQHATSAPYYSGRPVLRADLLDPAAFETIRAWAAREHRPIAFVFDTAELEVLRARLGADGLAALDWPPRAEIGRPVSTRIWLDTDRDAYRAGGTIPTARLVTVP